MRLLLALPLLLTACGASTDPAANSVDINAAARQAQSRIDDYAANAATPEPTPSPAATSPIVMPSPGPTPAAPTPAAPTPAAYEPPAPGTPGGLPDDRTPLYEAPFTPDSAQGAANVVQTYYALLGEQKYAAAWKLWGHDGKDSGLTAKAFAASFVKYSDYHANVGAPGEIDAGMSQRWVTVPVQVYGRLKTGAAVNMLGSITLHRIVPGVSATKADEKWHIRTADIKPRPG